MDGCAQLGPFPITSYLFWNVARIDKEPKTLQVMNGSVIPVTGWTMRPLQGVDMMADIREGPTSLEAVLSGDTAPTVDIEYPNTERKRWLPPELVPLIQDLLKTEDVNVIGVMADLIGERGDPREDAVRRSTSYGEVCFALKFGVNYADVRIAVQKSMESVGRSLEAVSRVMNESFMNLNKVCAEIGPTLAEILNPKAKPFSTPRKGKSRAKRRK